MVKRSVTLTLDEKYLASLEVDRGLTSLSAFINGFMETIYDDTTQVSKDLHTCRIVPKFDS